MNELDNISDASLSNNQYHEFASLNTLLLVVVLLLCITSSYIIKQYKLYYLPESSASIIVGLIVGLLARLLYPSIEEEKFLTFDPELFFFLILPPIIFEAGYNVEKKLFFSNFFTISLYAVVGTIISTFIIGYMVYLIGIMGLVKIDTSSPLESLLFGALLSATDPVATLSILGSSDINADPVCYSLVFGESVLNDAVAIVLFKTFEGFKGAKNFDIIQVFLKFAGVSIGSVFIGIVIGLLNCYLCKHTKMHQYPEYELSVLFLFAYGSYSFSESLQLSGIMSLFFCGMVLSHYNNYNLSASSKVTAQYMFKSLAVLCEFYVYLYLGIAIFTGRMKHFNFLFFLLSMIFCFIARFFNIFPLSIIANLFRKNKISRNMQLMIWFAGLRGAIAFSLSNNMPEEHRDLYVSTTLSVVIFTTVIIGGLTEPMTNYTGMKIVNDESSTPTNDYSRLVSTPDPENNNNNQDSTLDSGLEMKLNGLIYQFDVSVMQPVFGSPSLQSRNTEMVNT